MCAVQTINALGGKLISNTDKHNSFLTVTLKRKLYINEVLLEFAYLGKKNS
uniref:Uncharacterized protein n=1 Tax=Anguilla anguilla TaxID=7936 RepID=A0A0E9PIN1_ANGAN